MKAEIMELLENGEDPETVAHIMDVSMDYICDILESL
jgi:hypothetical protein